MIVDRFGRKGMFQFSMILLMVISVSHTCFPIVGAVLALRFVYGLGWGLANTSDNTIASDLIPRKRFGEGMGFLVFRQISPWLLSKQPPIDAEWRTQPFS